MAGNSEYGLGRMGRLLGSGVSALRTFGTIRAEYLRVRAAKEALRTRQHIESGEVSGQLQTGKLAALRDAENAGLFDPDGLYIGLLGGEPLYTNSDAPLLTYASTGAGKSSCCVVTNLLHTAGKRTVIATDVGGDLAFMTRDYRTRKQQGERCYFINPFQLRDLPNHRFNPLQNLVALAERGDPVGPAAKAAVTILLPDIAAASRGTNQWIVDNAGELAHACLMYLAYEKPDLCTLSELWNIANSTDTAFRKLLKEMKASKASDGFVSIKAKKFEETYPKGSEQLNWVKDALDKVVDLYAPGNVLRDSVAASDFNPEDLKRHPGTAYIIIPGSLLESHAAWIALVMNGLIETIAAAEGEVRSLFLFDEYPSLPKMESTFKGLRLYRKAGIQPWFFVQDRQGFKAYGPDAHKVFEEAAEVHQMWAIEDVSLLRDLQDRAGYASVMVPSQNYNFSMTEGANHGGVEQVTPVLPISEIAKIKNGKIFLRIKGYDIFVADLLPWFKIDPWRKWGKSLYAP